MTPFNSIILLVFGVIAYMMILDSNVSEYLTLVFKMIQINVERFYWIIRFHPKNPITNLIKRWEYAKIARELEKEFNDKLSNSD
jgi:hypothetical protein